MLFEIVYVQFRPSILRIELEKEFQPPPPPRLQKKKLIFSINILIILTLKQLFHASL